MSLLLQSQIAEQQLEIGRLTKELFIAKGLASKLNRDLRLLKAWNQIQGYIPQQDIQERISSTLVTYEKYLKGEPIENYDNTTPTTDI